ncbi:hypothetical protein SAMN05444680_103490 [Variovorax sp. YR216]|nr:hypothetical protein SAMN05444680_103490 [Variovorax sp. YR216]
MGASKRFNSLRDRDPSSIDVSFKLLYQPREAKDAIVFLHDLGQPLEAADAGVFFEVCNYRAKLLFFINALSESLCELENEGTALTARDIDEVQ